MGRVGENKIEVYLFKAVVNKLSLESLLLPWQADYKIDSKFPPSPLGGQMEESNSKQLQQQDSEKKYDATTSAPAVSSPVFPAPAAPASTAPATISTREPTAPATISTCEPQENGNKRPRTASSQMHYNLARFLPIDFHTNPNVKGVADYYSWDALARPGDHSR
ncbi:hypothetical protein CRYUN_Cryun16bG0034500 [Craigia yunnanensis]